MESYADPMWWNAAFHHTLPLPSDLERHLAPESCISSLDILQWTSDHLNDGLRSIAEGNIPIQYVRRFLFRLKALKKWRLPVSSQADRAHRAMAGFVQRNQLALDDPALGLSDELAYLMSGILREWLPDVGSEGITGRFGPGAVAEHYTHPRRYDLLDVWVRNPHWPETPLDRAEARHSQARLCAVPKDWNKDRLITVEPCYSSFVQQYVRSVLLKSIHAGPLRGTCLDFDFVDSPERQRRLALRASRYRDAATLDLSDASDGITWYNVQRVFPKWVLDLLWVSRSSSFTAESRVHQLAIYAGMGNATTFVIESLYFAAYVLAFGRRELGKRIPVRSPVFGVFGDDIIVPNTLAQALIEDGQCASFKINTLKSFVGDDLLRESCGVFAFDGVDITVPKVDGYRRMTEPLRDLTERLLDDEDLYPLAETIVKSGGVLNLPFAAPGLMAVCCESLPYAPYPKLRFNHAYQRWECMVRAAVPVNRRFSHTQSVWLTGRLLGTTSTTTDGHATLFPTGRLKERNVWRPVTWTECLSRGIELPGVDPACGR